MGDIQQYNTQTLKQLEAIIEKDIAAFVRVGYALLSIRARKLYQDDTWRDYLERRWPQYHTSHIYHLMNAAHIKGYLENSTVVEFLPNTEGQIRPLTQIGTFKQHEMKKIDPDVWVKAWIRACDLAKPKFPTEKHVKKAVSEIQRGKIIDDMPSAETWTGQWAFNKIYLTDVTKSEWLITMPKDSIDFIITDPPWRPDPESNGYELYETVGRMANKCLKPGGFCAVYLGKLDLPILLHILTQYLDWEWPFASYQPHGTWNFRKTQYKECWRPIGIFRKPGDRIQTVYYPDAIESLRDKDYHEWQQGIEPIKTLINKYTAEGHLILDPYCGGGTTPVAALETGRNFLAFDNDEIAIAGASRRIKEWQQKA